MHFDTVRTMGKRGLVASVAITALVMVLLGLALVGAVFAAALLAESDASTDQWDDLGAVLFALVIGVLLMPVFAAILLHLLKVPRALLIIAASVLTVGVDLSVTQLVYNEDSQLLGLAGFVLIPTLWSLVLHPSVLRIGADQPQPGSSPG